jgi:hypothetical protein
LKIAKLNAASGFIHHTIATIINGKMILIPKTAIAIPRVRNLCCHFASIFFNTVALTTALSNDRETSNTHKMITMNTVCNPADMLSALPAHKKNAMIIAITVKIIEPLKCFIKMTTR